MNKYALMLAALVVTLGLYWLYQLGRGLDKAKELTAKNFLVVSYAELQKFGAFTNPSPEPLRIYSFTNDFIISGTNYRCVLAADSWHRLGTNRRLAITTNGLFLMINEGQAELASSFPISFPPTNSESN